MANRFNQLLPGIRINPKVSQYVPQEYIPGDVYLGMPVDAMVEASNKLQQKFDLENLQAAELAGNLKVNALDKAEAFGSTVEFKVDQEAKQKLLNTFGSELSELTESISNGDIRNLGKVRSLAKRFVNDPTRQALEKRYAVAQDYFKEQKKAENTPGQEYVRNNIDLALRRAASDFSTIPENLNLIKGLDYQGQVNKLFDGVGVNEWASEGLSYDPNTGVSMVKGGGGSTNEANLRKYESNYINNPELRQATKERLTYEFYKTNPDAVGTVDPKTLDEVTTKILKEEFVNETNKRLKTSSKATVSNIDFGAGGKLQEFKANTPIPFRQSAVPGFASNADGDFDPDIFREKVKKDFTPQTQELIKKSVKDRILNDRGIGLIWKNRKLGSGPLVEIVEAFTAGDVTKAKALMTKTGLSALDQENLIYRFNDIEDTKYEDVSKVIGNISNPLSFVFPAPKAHEKERTKQILSSAKNNLPEEAQKLLDADVDVAMVAPTVDLNGNTYVNFVITNTGKDQKVVNTAVSVPTKVLPPGVVAEVNRLAASNPTSAKYVNALNSGLWHQNQKFLTELYIAADASNEKTVTIQGTTFKINSNTKDYTVTFNHDGKSVSLTDNNIDQTLMKMLEIQ